MTARPRRVFRIGNESGLDSQAKRPQFALTAMLLLLALPVSAGEISYYSQPGLCNVHDGVLEESDAIHLDDRSLGNHYFDCSFKIPIAKALQKDGGAQTEARCENGTGNWTAKFEIVKRDDGTLHVFQESGGLSPMRFHPCQY